MDKQIKQVNKALLEIGNYVTTLDLPADDLHTIIDKQIQILLDFKHLVEFINKKSTEE